MNLNKIISSTSDYVGVMLFGTVRGRGGSAVNSVHVLQELGLPGDQRIMELDRLTSGQSRMPKYYQKCDVPT